MKPLIVYPIGGLGNQIRVVASTFKYAQEFGVPLIVQYSPGDDQVFHALRTLAHWEACFDFPLPFTLIRYRRGFTRVDVRQLKLNGCEYPALLRKVIEDGAVFASDAGLLNRPFPPPNQVFNLSYRTHQAVNQLIGEARSKFGTDQLYGIHLRYAQGPAAQYSPLELFAERLKDHAGPFYLAADTVECRERFLSLFKRDDIIWSPWAELAQGTVEDTWRAWVDMITLSRCTEIFGSFWSSFDEMAAYLGEVKVTKIRTYALGN